jgi:hypothetical protein
MLSPIHQGVGTWQDHIRALSEDIGPRGSTTEGERRGSEYCEKVLADLGLKPMVERFRSARSIYFPHLLAASLMLLSFAVYPLIGRESAAAAAAIATLALASELLELSFRDNILRRLAPKGTSQNVIATVRPSGEHRMDILLVGHVDSHRTPIIFSSPRWVSAYQAFTTVAFVLFAGQAVLYVLGAFTGWLWIWPTTLASVVAALLLIALCVQADSTPYSAGANDNATGAGLVLSLAGQAASRPLQHSRLWLACTGCEEVQHYGAIDFFRRHLAEMRNPVAIVFEMMGCAGPAWLTREGIVVPFRADPRLAGVAEELSASHPEWGAYPTQIRGGNTEMADAHRARVPAITLNGMTRAGQAPYWHQVADTYDKIDRDALARGFAFTWELIQTLDQHGLPESRSDHELDERG